MKKSIAFLLCVCMILSLAACGVAAPKEPAQEQTPVVEQKPADDAAVNLSGGAVLGSEPKGEYNEGVVLVKVEEALNAAMLGELAYTSAEALYAGSKWYSVQLAEGNKAEDAVEYLLSLDTLEGVDYDYIMKTGVVDVSCNPDYGKDHHHGIHKIPEGWGYMDENNMNPGGSPDVVVAVIDTGVDYTHLDLRNNIWTNTAEIPGNGIDDDGNGYVDDVRGWDCVGNDADPMDDNGHGTHVAGIVAAENNDIGAVGIAYNCKIMVLKAGNSSGYFNNSDIAEAIQYAYMNGADIINMSFGGPSIAIAVEEALENAYNSCILVAAAGNASLSNTLTPYYPAAFPYVIGVMSCDASGSNASGFTNYDDVPYNDKEYEVYACGEAVYSTWPGNKHTALNGTSMAAPAVSAIAALLRSAYPDREVYSTKYIQSQIVNTGTKNPFNSAINGIDDFHSVVDAYEALIYIPKPAVSLYDYRIDDSVAIAEVNNGNGVIDAGETIRLYISLHNRGGVASNVNVTIDTIRNDDPSLTDPYFTFVNSSVTLSDIGTYSVRDAYEDEYFEIIVSPDCPNDYLTDFNIRFTYTNGMDEKDPVTYNGVGRARFNVSRGFHLPSIIAEDTVYTADRLYIVGENVVIPEGVTVTFEEGCEIQFYDDRTYYDSPQMIVYGTLNFAGTKQKMISIHPGNRYASYACIISVCSLGELNVDYADIVNLDVAKTYMNGAKGTAVINDSYLRVQKGGYYGEVYAIIGGKAKNYPGHSMSVDAINRSHIEKTQLYCKNVLFNLVGCNIVVTPSNWTDLDIYGIYKDNILMNTQNGMSSYATKLVFYSSAGGVISNNIFAGISDKVIDYAQIAFKENCVITSNKLLDGYREYPEQMIENYYNADGTTIIDANGSLADASLLWPHVVGVEMFDKDGTPITRVGREEITVRVTFNRPMDTTKDTYLTFGTIEPYADYKIIGSYISDTVWEGTYTLKAQIENGQNFLKVENACAAEDPTKTIFGEYQLHEFTIDTTAAMSMNLQAIAKNEGIELTFAQDDYDTLLGYNIYRSEDKDGNFVKMNPTIVLPEENTFLDTNAEPGKTYWYTYTVVLSDFTESNPAGKVQATAKDTMAPSLYHTPVNQGYENNNLVISCTASDNVGIQTVTLYYRIVGETQWKQVDMVKHNDKYSAKIFGTDVTLAGIEYYIVASDTLNTVQKGSADAPYTVVVKSADSLLGMGDVDGNGQVTTKDALMLMQCLNGDLILTDDAFKRADLNGDKVLSAAEALRILQYINGKVTSLEM